MKRILYILFLVSFSLFAQEKTTQKKSEVTDLIQEGVNSYNKADYLDADKAFRKALASDPGSGVAAYNLGLTQIAEEKPLEAVHYFGKASKNADKKSLKNKAYFNAGNVWFHKKKYERAIEAYKNALRNVPEDEEARYNLALAKQMLKKQNKSNKKNNKKNKKNDKKKDNKKNDQNKKDKNKKDQNKKNKDKQGKDKKDQKKKQDEKKKQDDQNKKDKQKQEKNKQNQNKEQQRKKVKLTPQQVKQLLVGLKNKEQKTQKKIKAHRLKGSGKKKKQEKDW